MKKQRKKKMIGWIITFIVLAVLGIAGGVGWFYLSREHRKLPICRSTQLTFQA